jgi:hypothetical protein
VGDCATRWRRTNDRWKYGGASGAIYRAANNRHGTSSTDGDCSSADGQRKSANRRHPAESESRHIAEHDEPEWIQPQQHESEWDEPQRNNSGYNYAEHNSDAESQYDAASAEHQSYAESKFDESQRAEPGQQSALAPAAYGFQSPRTGMLNAAESLRQKSGAFNSPLFLSDWN